MELDFIPLEDGLDYGVVETIEVNNNRYLLLAKENDESNVVVRKVIRKEGKEYIVKLDSNEEFEDVMTAYNEKEYGDND